MIDRHTRSSIVGPNRLEQAEDVLRAQCCPEGEELMTRVGEGPAATDRHEAGVSDFREDHRRQQPYHLNPRSRYGTPVKVLFLVSAAARPRGSRRSCAPVSR
jgi:hypothetical protein